MLRSLILLTSILPSLAAIIPRAPCEISLSGSTVTGLETNGACRYVVEYAEAGRWDTSTLVSDFGGHTSTSLPPACPQAPSFYASAGQAEACLWNAIYTPSSAPPSSGFPVLVWVHGGSSLMGSASAPGLDGAHLATTGNIIVVVVQYRLGVLGFVPPTQASTSSDPNLGLQDIIHALQSVQSNIAAFGGDPSKVTVGGQSSGASMIRALLASPAAAGLFRAGILQSDPMIYGFSSTSLTSQLQSWLYSNTQLSSCSTLDCLKAVSTDGVLAAQASLSQNAPYMFDEVPFSFVMRPTYGTSTIPLDPTPALFGKPSGLSTSNIPLLITTARNEGGQAVQQLFSNPIGPNNNTYLYTLSALIGLTRAGQIVNSPQYALPSSAESGSDVFREKFELATTDGTWRCPSRDVAAHWAGAGQNVWVGEWAKGETYPTNQYGGYCTSSGRVCHEDDLFSTFGTGTDSNLEDQVNSYWISFVTSLNPGSDWQPYSASNTGTQGIKALGGGDVLPCPSGLWGSTFKYDWQLYA